MNPKKQNSFPSFQLPQILIYKENGVSQLASDRHLIILQMGSPLLDLGSLFFPQWILRTWLRRSDTQPPPECKEAVWKLCCLLDQRLSPIRIELGAGLSHLAAQCHHFVLYSLLLRKYTDIHGMLLYQCRCV